MRTVSIVGKTRIGILASGLPRRMQNFDVIRLAQSSFNNHNITAIPLVCPYDSIAPPVGPVDMRFKHCQGKRMRKKLVTSDYFL
jgi:hypothetical protein